MRSPFANPTSDGAEQRPPSGDSTTRERKNSNDETMASGARRHRASRACQYCRFRKVRCDVLRNAAGCTNCRLDSRKCVLLASRRGRTRSFLCDDSDTIPRTPSSRSPNPVFDLDANATAPDDAPSPITVPTSVESAGSSDVPVCVTFHGDDGDIDNEEWPVDHATTTDYTSSEHHDILALASNGSVTSTMQHHASPGGTVPLPSFIAPLRNKLPPEDVEFLAMKGSLTIPEIEFGREILKAYSFSVHPSMPMLDLKPFVEALEGDGKDTHISLLLFQAVMFAGLSSLEQHTLYRFGFNNAKQAREVFFNRVKLLYDFDVEPDIGVVFQSLLLMSSWYSKWNEWKDTSHWTVQAFLVAQNMGLHREPSSACGSVKLQRQRRRMWWSLFIRDRMLALGTRRPMRIRDDDFDVSMLTLEDFDIESLAGPSHEHLGNSDAEEQRSTALMCIELAKLCVCIGHVLSTQYTTLSTKPAVSFTTMVVPRRTEQQTRDLQKCDAEIDEWFEQLSTNTCRPSSMLQSKSSATCSEVQWAILDLAHLTLVNVLHRTQAIQPPSTTPEIQAIRQASKIKVKNAARKVTKIAQTMLHRYQVHFLGLSGVTALLAACLSHMGEVLSGDEDVRDASIFRFNQCMQVLQPMRGVYASADAAVTFLASVARKAELDLLAQGNTHAQCTMPTASYHPSQPLKSTNTQSGWSEVAPLQESHRTTTHTASKAFGPGQSTTQYSSGSQPTTQTTALPSANRHGIDHSALALGRKMPDVMNDGSNRNLKIFGFDDTLFENPSNLAADDFAMNFEPILYNYDFFLDTSVFPDGNLQGME